MPEEQDEALEIEDVNHFDSRVFIRFADGRTVLLTGREVLEAAERRQQRESGCEAFSLPAVNRNGA